MFRRWSIALIAGSLAIASSAALAHGTDKAGRVATLDPDQTLRVSQRALGGTVGNHRLTGADGTTIKLDDLRGKPVVISLIYTGCTHICPMITQRLRQAVEQAQRVIGNDRFAVLTIGFDTRNDTPMRMAAYARAQGIDLPGWRVFSADEATIDALAKDLGFSFAASAGGYLHTSQVSLLDAQGRVYRQIYGDDFPIQVFMEPLKEAVYGTVGSFLSVDSLVDRVRFLCTVYDPNSGRYRISYAIAMSLLAGIISLGTTAVIVSRAWLNSRRSTPL